MSADSVPPGLIYRIHNAPRLYDLGVPEGNELRLVKLSPEDCAVIIAALQSADHVQP